MRLRLLVTPMSLPITINTNQGFQRVFRSLQTLPHVLTGQAPDPSRIREAFLSFFVHHLLRRICQAYLEKSRSHSDDLGYRWKPLAPATVAAKLRSRYSRPPVPTDFLSSPQKALWTRFYNQALKQYSNDPGAARQVAWKKLQLSKLPTGVAINIETGRLLASLQPGEVSNGRYLPPTEQTLRFNGSGVELRSLVPYALYVHRRRRLYPPARAMRPWVCGAALLALRDVANAQLREELT